MQPYLSPVITLNLWPNLQAKLVSELLIRRTICFGIPYSGSIRRRLSVFLLSFLILFDFLFFFYFFLAGGISASGGGGGGGGKTTFLVQ